MKTSRIYPYGTGGLAVLLVASAGIFLSCDNPAPEPDPGVLNIAIADEKGQLPVSFSLRLSLPDGTAETACIAGGISDNPAVTPALQGCTAAMPAESMVVAITSPGYRSARYAHHRPNSGANVLSITLHPLESGNATNDYCSSFSPSGGPDEFRALAVKQPGETGVTYTVKFYIEHPDSEPAVYFQNTVRHPLHYNFARDVLGRALSRAEFEERTYSGDPRSALAGSVVWHSGFTAGKGSPDSTLASPFTVEFFPSDNLTPLQALAACLLLEERMQFIHRCSRENRLCYLPPTTAHESALKDYVRDFGEYGIEWLSRAALYSGVTMQLLNSGETYGTLRRLSPEGLVSMPLSYRDIVLLTRLPNDMPLVGGSITEELQTPLAHVNVAARSRKTPNMALQGASGKPEIAALFDSIVHFSVTADTFILEKATNEEAERFWAQRTTDPPEIAEADLLEDSLRLFSALSFGDRGSIGVKAANCAELSNLLGKQAPDGLAVPFSWYKAYLDYSRLTPEVCAAAKKDCGAEGRDGTVCEAAAAYRDAFGKRNAGLREFIDSLIVNERFINDTRFREASLDGVRYIIRHLPVDAASAGKLDFLADSLFHGLKIRLRSSTNAEDLEDFSGAGLYSSTGADATGAMVPSDEIRKVWASVWNWQAFEERSFRGIDHRKIYMGVAVHRAFTAEAANGVLVTRNLADPAVDGFYVNVQPGEASVTNPADGSLPEIFTATPAGIIRQRYSSLSPDAPVLADAEIAALHTAASGVLRRFSELYGKSAADPAFALEMEFKLDAPDRTLFIKQVRPFSQ